MTPCDWNRARLRRAAEVSFLANSARREARRKRWAGQSPDLAAELLREFLGGAFYTEIATERGMAPSSVRDIIRKVATEEQLAERRRMLHRARERKRHTREVQSA